jgi:type I restriction enzyme, S subunit
MRKGWQKRTLGELIQLVSGQHIDARDYNIECRGIGYLTGPSDFGPINPIVSKWTEFPKVKAQKGDILITVKGSGVGKINLLEQDEIAISRQLMAVRVTGADARFIYAFLSSTFDHFQSESTGAAIPGVSRQQVLRLKITLPPLPEQHRIVAILDEAFEHIATAKANAAKNLQNARALFGSYLQSVFTQRGTGWVQTTIGDQLMLQRGFDITKDQQNQGDVPVVSSGGIKSFHDKAMSQAPGVVIGRKGTLGKVFYLEDDFWPHDTTLWVKEFKGNDPRFVYYFFTGLDVKRLDSGTANPALNRNQVHPIEVNWPPVTRQKTIVATLDTLAEETRRLESIYERKLATLEELKKSLLHQAFTGEL